MGGGVIEATTGQMAGGDADLVTDFRTNAQEKPRELCQYGAR